uniref:G2/mitotic-specific cyclin-B2 n=1 Tax=Periophthalmus magnuspinnatus TaxID=409849 RepID=A0A3B4B7Y7_9GOBI
MPFTRGKKPAVSAASRLPKLSSRANENQEEGSQVKRSSSPPTGAPKKRTAFIDITNAHKVGLSLPGRKKEATKKTVKKPAVASSSVSARNQKWPDIFKSFFFCLFQIPAEFDIDAENREDCVMCPEYAKDIFDYLKQREEKFVLQDYMPQQSSLNAEMRAILVDWLVEVQENFELYHETLYLAVKMTDHYLSKTSVHREMLQLVGSTAMLIASKFEERSPPCVDDFLYICDDAFKREELITMEGSILQTLGFDINIPISYRFLRRYAKCVNTGMDTLTLARYFCEMSLLEMDLVLERGSLLASACLLLALLTKDLGGWTPCLQFHSGYDLCDLSPVVRKLYFCLSAPLDERLKAIRNKYSHKVFFEVAKLPLVDLDVLENALLKKEKTEEPI